MYHTQILMFFSAETEVHDEHLFIITHQVKTLSDINIYPFHKKYNILQTYIHSINIIYYKHMHDDRYSGI